MYSYNTVNIREYPWNSSFELLYVNSIAKSMWTPDHDTDLTMCLLNILFQMLAPPLAVIITYTSLGKLSSRFRSLVMGICAHSVSRTLVRSGTGVWCVSLCSNSSQRCWVEVTYGVHGHVSTYFWPQSVCYSNKPYPHFISSWNF